MSELLVSPNTYGPPDETFAHTEAFLEAVARLAGGAGHEINNPLTVISGRAQLMMESAGTEDERNVWRTIHLQAGRISDLIADLMEFAAPLHTYRQKIDLVILIKNAISHISYSNHPNAEAFKIDKEIEDPIPQVWVDPVQIESVIAELLENSITFSIKEPYIQLSVAITDNSQVLLAIRDNGPGMNPQTLAHAFVPFFSSHSAGRRRGLGLSLAWRRVVSNQGRIWLESEPGKGTVAKILLPTAK